VTAVLAPEDDAPEARPVSRGRRIGLAAPAYLPALMIAVGGWQHRWMDEDAFINLRIIDQIFAGHGPVFNAGERVEAATSTIWIGVLVIGRLLFGSFASLGHTTLQVSGQFVHLGELVTQLNRRLTTDAGSMCSSLLKLANRP